MSAFLPAPVSISGLVGRVVTDVKLGDKIEMTTSDGYKFTFELRDKDVAVETAVALGDLKIFEGVEVQYATAHSNHVDEDCGQMDWGSETWHIHRFITVKGGVTIRWTDGDAEFFNHAVELNITRDEDVQTPEPVVKED